MIGCRKSWRDRRRIPRATEGVKDIIDLIAFGSNNVQCAGPSDGS
jgi:hypothetical protein